MIHIQEWFAGACIVFLFATGWFCGKEAGYAKGYEAAERHAWRQFFKLRDVRSTDYEPQP